METIPCTTTGCESVKFFAGRCNACQRELDVALPPLVDRYAGLSETEEYMIRTGIPRDKVLAQTRR